MIRRTSWLMLSVFVLSILWTNLSAENPQDFYAYDGWYQTTSSECVMLGLNYLQSKTSCYTFIKQQKLNHEMAQSSATYNKLEWDIRVSSKNKTIRTAGLAKLEQLKNLYGHTMPAYLIRKHKCKNAYCGGECTWTILFQKP